MFSKRLQVPTINVILGFADYDAVLESQFQDQCWLLWLIRCYNRDQYTDDSECLPMWIHDLFVKLRKTQTFLHKKYSTTNQYMRT